MPSIIVVCSNKLPQYMTAGSSGMDVHAHISNSVYVFPHCTVLIPTGVQVAIPSGYEVQIRPRSGFSIQNAVLLPNSPGTIDSDYRGEIKIALRNIASSLCIVYPDDRVAQMICARSEQVHWACAETLPTTIRNHDGFGSTGQ